MIRHRSRLALTVVLVFAVGVFFWGRWRNRLTWEASREEISPAAGQAGGQAEEFGPIPPAYAPGSPPAVPPRRDSESASREMRMLAERMSRETEDLKVVTHEDGRRSVALEGRFLHMSAVVDSVDGKPKIQCFTDYQQMAAALPGGQAAASPRPPTHAR